MLMNRRRLKRLVSSAMALLGIPVTLLAHAFPRDPKLWIFGSWAGVRFADNSKYLFLSLTNSPVAGIRPVWITRDRSLARRLRESGFQAFATWSLRGVWSLLRAGVYLFDCRIGDLSRSTVGRAKRVNLWHGMPLKKINHDIPQQTNVFRRAYNARGLRRLIWQLVLPEAFERYDFVLAPSRAVAPIFQSAFQVQPEQVVVAPYPRLDSLRVSTTAGGTGSDAEDLLQRQIDQARSDGKRIIAYIPTFRDSTASASPIPLDWPAIHEALGRNNARLLLKLHPVDRMRLPPLDFETMTVVSSDCDLYSFLKDVDILITDYSSVYFDYVVLDRPIIFFPYDLADYRQHSRELYFDYESVTPGPRVFSSSQLVDELTDTLVNYEQARARQADDRARVGETIHPGYATSSAKDTARTLVRRLVSLEPVPESLEADQPCQL